MNIQELTEVILRLEGWMPESTRTLLAYRLLAAVASHLPKGQLERFHEQNGTEKFLHACKLTQPLPHVKPGLNIEETALAQFCNKWENVVEYKGEDGDYRPLTAEMHSIRHTMVQELNKLRCPTPT